MTLNPSFNQVRLYSEPIELDHSSVIPGHQIPVQHQKKPGLQEELDDPKSVSAHIPSVEESYETHKATGKLAGKRAIITSGDSRISRAIAILFAMEEASSLIVYLPEEERGAQETKGRVQDTGHYCHCLAVDVRKKENCRKVVDTAVQCMGGIDILVNNAGFQNMVEDISGLEEDQWGRTFDTNTHPFFYLSKYALRHMGSGSSIINCGSINAYVGRPDLLDYTATKGAIVAFTRGLSNQQVGRVGTPLMPSTMTSSAMDQFSSVPMGRPGQPSEVATCFVFLASQDSSYISGQPLHPNGVAVNG
ncbi:oxidoreductase [Aspergillus bombycis]|uniref:Oxidoreductase n=1 Tax=Aspergillus bombycis TaxID=109264 RepID=A0A1F7ZS19_9EURO|nr:oxidoreductase [Aspergillus bombycis]OGM42059.1 oxidoreductase [Aspergillus bombycis]